MLIKKEREGIKDESPPYHQPDLIRQSEGG
jgi:hypothetical protein